MYIYYISAFVHHFRTFKFRGENLDGQVFQLLHNCCMDLRLPGNKVQYCLKFTEPVY